MTDGFAWSILGHAVRFESEDADVLRLAQEFAVDLGGMEAGSADLHVRITVRTGASPAPIAPVGYVDDAEGRLHLTGPHVSGVVDGSRHESIAEVSREFLAEGDRFRDEVVAALTFALVATFDRHPIHASAVATGSGAMLFAGASGAGKSTLASLAYDLGFDVLSDDRVWVQLAPAMAVWGGPAHAREIVPGGAKRFRPLPPRGRRMHSPATFARVCVLARGPRVAAEKISEADVYDALTRDVAPGFNRFPGRHENVAAALASGGGWRLTLTRHPGDVKPILRELLASATE